MSFPLGHLPGISDSLGSRWSTRSLLKPDLSPGSTISWFIQTLNPESSPLPRQSFIMSYCSKPPIATSSPSFLVKTSISTVVLTGLPTANLAHFHFITQLERSLKNKNQIVPTPTWNTPATSLHSEKKIPTPSSAVVVVTVCCPDPPWDQELTAESLPRQGASSSKVIRGRLHPSLASAEVQSLALLLQFQTDTAPPAASSEICIVTASLLTGSVCPVWFPSLLPRCCTWEHSPGNLLHANLHSEFRSWANWSSYEVLYNLAPAQCLVFRSMQTEFQGLIGWLFAWGKHVFCMKWSALGMCLVALRGIVRQHPG